MKSPFQKTILFSTMKNQIHLSSRSEACRGSARFIICHRGGAWPGLLLDGCCAVLTGLAGPTQTAGASDGQITIWDVASHQEVPTLDGHKEETTQLAFTPDGDHLVSVKQGPIASLARPRGRRLKPQRRRQEMSETVCLNPNGIGINQPRVARSSQRWA